jgi:hypothetical protein
MEEAKAGLHEAQAYVVSLTESLGVDVNPLEVAARARKALSSQDADWDRGLPDNATADHNKQTLQTNWKQQLSHDAAKVNESIAIREEHRKQNEQGRVEFYARWADAASKSPYWKASQFLMTRGNTMPEYTTSICNHCHIEKPLNNFPHSKAHKYNVCPKCAACLSVVAKEKYRRKQPTSKVCKSCHRERDIESFQRGRQHTGALCFECKLSRKMKQPVTLTERRCASCREIKPAADFCIARNISGGLACYCRRCMSQKYHARKRRDEFTCASTGSGSFLTVPGVAGCEGAGR